MIVCARALKTIRTASPLEMLAAMPPKTTLPARAIRKATMIVQKTGQPLPRTSSRERPKAAKTPLRSITITGAITAQIVIRKSPGAISSDEADPDPDPGEQPGADQRQQHRRRVAESSRTEESRLPSWTSRTRPTTIPW